MCVLVTIHEHKHSIVQPWEIITPIPQFVVLHECMTIMG